jgi:hypothetical protein
VVFRYLIPVSISQPDIFSKRGAMQTNDSATKEDVARLETRIALLEGLLNEVLGLLRGMALPGSAPLPTKRQVDPAYLPGGVEWMKLASEEERREYNRKEGIRRRKRGFAPRKNG